jgi:hypothetical protein
MTQRWIHSHNSYHLLCVCQLPLYASVTDPSLSLYPLAGLKAAEVVELCQGAQNIGPAQCFVQSRGLGTTAERTHLCNGAFSAVCLCAGHHCIVERSRCALSPFS